MSLLSVCVGTLVGVLSALLGVGGGLFMVPYLVLVSGLDQHVAEGTSLLAVIPTAAVSVWMHRRTGYISAKHVPLLGIAGLIGAFAGASIALALPADTLKSLFGVLLVYSAARMIARGVRDLRKARVNEQA